MNPHAIETKSLRRSFDKRAVLTDLNLRVPRGSIYGFIGRNGAGKTTTMKILAGLARAEGGEVRVLGSDPWGIGAEERQRIGYLSEAQNLPARLRVRRLIAFCAQFYPAWDRMLCDELVSRFQISPHQRVGALSLGSQRLLGIILALAPRPEVLLLDEPAANLDVVARREFLDQILDLIRDGGSTVFFSTHILSDIERVADQVGILVNGTLRVSCPLDELKESIQQVRFFDFSGAMPDGLPGSLSLKRSSDGLLATLDVRVSGPPQEIAARWNCRHETHPLSLEDIFVELTKN
ncbi:MAG: ABC transporter ATP-binding protein [Terrimicrobiaceae bacterium]|nr:ABC transporter ATP-binding protein [Terrimicrobiaceae bacterium]